MLTFDSNLLIYALDRGEPERQAMALHVLTRAPLVAAFLTQQVIGEFCNVTFRKRLLDPSSIRSQVEDWANVYAVVPTRSAQLLEAIELAERRQKQFWDMVLVRVAADAGATALFTDDIGDGEVIDGVHIINPFDPANADRIAALLTPSP